MVDLTAETLPELLTLLRDSYYTMRRGAWVFRGHSRASYELIPSVGRFPHTSRSYDKLESSLLAMFQRGATSHLRSQPRNKWEWLALAQHHGLPTRLLDWAFNPLVALYFAVKEDPGTDAIIFALQAGKKISETFVENYDPLQIDVPMKYLPTAQTPRIVAQEGLFTVQPQIAVPLSEQIRTEWSLQRIIIPAASKADFLYQLFRQGVHRASLFPDIDGLANHIRWQHTVLPFDDAEPSDATERSTAG